MKKPVSREQHAPLQGNAPAPDPSGPRSLNLRVSWDKAGSLTARTAAGCGIPMAATDEAFSSGACPSPIEVFVASLGGCPGHEILGIMNEKGPVVKSLEVSIRGTRRATLPTVFENLHVTFHLEGDISEEYARRVIDDVMTLRCPVAVSFARATDLTWDFRIVSAARQ